MLGLLSLLLFPIFLIVVIVAVLRHERLAKAARPGVVKARVFDLLEGRFGRPRPRQYFGPGGTIEKGEEAEDAGSRQGEGDN
jgi:8-oxo-dGTP pyrophosphatase MutT (NUDIX family)